MAGGKSPFLLLAFILMFVLVASAHRPLVVEKLDVAASPHHDIDGHKKHEVDIDGKRGMGKGEMKGKGNKMEHSLKTNMGKGEMKGKGNKMEHSLKTNMGKWEMKGKGNKMEHSLKTNMGKWEMKGEEEKKMEHDDALKTNGLGTGLYSIPNPVSYPGVDGGVHIDLGAFGFGLQGGLQWGGNPYPVYVVPYNQPYVMVSPYSGSYPYPTPYMQPGSGNGSPQQGHEGSFSSPGSYAQGQGQGQGQSQGQGPGQGPYQGN